MLAVAARLPRVAEQRVELLPGEPHELGIVGEQDLAAEHARTRVCDRDGVELADGVGSERRVVVQQQHPVGAAIEARAQADVVAAGEAEVLAFSISVTEGRRCTHGLGGAVARCVVDADDVERRPTRRARATSRQASVSSRPFHESTTIAQRCALAHGASRRSYAAAMRAAAAADE